MDLKYYLNRIIKKIRGVAIKGSVIHPTSKIESGSQIVNVSMGKHSYCGYDCTIIDCNIGNFCSISDRVVIGGASHPIEWVSTSPVFYAGRDSVKTKFSEFSFHKEYPTKRIIIGSDVWIGSDVLIRPDVNIGNGVVVGMGSVVTKNVPDYAIVAGNPARVLRMRFEEEEVMRELSEIAWWEMDDSKIAILAQYIQDTKQFIMKAKQV